MRDRKKQKKEHRLHQEQVDDEACKKKNKKTKKNFEKDKNDTLTMWRRAFLPSLSI